MCMMQHSKEIPHIASSDPLPKSMAEKNSNFLRLACQHLASYILECSSSLFCTYCPQTLHINPSTRWLTMLFHVKPLSPKELCWSHLTLCWLAPWRPPSNSQVGWVHVTRDKWATSQTTCLHNYDFFSVIKSFHSLCGNYTLLTKYS